MPADRPRRGPKWHARHQAIVDRSATVFARRGYHATGIAELCDANGLGRGALYYYIGSKEELLVAIHDRVMDEVVLGADRVQRAGGSPSEQLAAHGRELLLTIARYPDHVWVFLHEFPALSGARATAFRRRRQEYQSRIEDVIRAGIDQGEMRPVDPTVATLGWLGMHNYTYIWMRPSGRLAADEVAAQFADIAASGLVLDRRSAGRSRRRVAAVDDER